MVSSLRLPTPYLFRAEREAAQSRSFAMEELPERRRLPSPAMQQVGSIIDERRR